MSQEAESRTTRPLGSFARLYVIAWASYIVAYGLALGTAMDLSLAWVALGALSGGLPPALLGWLVFRHGRSVRWEEGRRGRFFALHATAAAGYALFSATGTFLLLRVSHRLLDGRWDWAQASIEEAVWHILMGTLLYTVLAGLGHTAALTQRLREEEARLARARELAARMELEALRSRLDPHFLFNTLHSLLALVRCDPRAAEEGLERFGELLHYTLRTRGDREAVPLSEEWAFVADFLALETLRLADRLSWEQDLSPEALACEVPAFTVQPLVENAVRYAVAPRAGGGRLVIRASVAEGLLTIEVSDDGPGAEPDEIEDGGEGLELVRERLQAVHGRRAGLEIENGTAGSALGGLTVRVRLPARPARPKAHLEASAALPSRATGAA
jgi:signal transduction histidine kinase